MSALVLLDVVAALALLHCSAGSVSPAWSSATLTSATVSTSSLDDDQIASIAGTIQAHQRVLGELAESHAGDDAVRSLGRRFADDNSVRVVPPPLGGAHGGTVQDELVDRDVTAELRLARFGGHSFDRAFLEGEREVLERGIELVNGVLVPKATSPALKEKLAQLGALLSEELEQLRALSAREVAR